VLLLSSLYREREPAVENTTAFIHNNNEYSIQHKALIKLSPYPVIMKSYSFLTASSEPLNRYLYQKKLVENQHNFLYCPPFSVIVILFSKYITPRQQKLPDARPTLKSIL
jgi:hypothetical protein